MSDQNTADQRRCALVTGAASGIGRGIAERLVSDGFRVALADINLPQAQKVADELNEGRSDERAVAVSMDVVSEASVQAAMAEVVDRFGSLDVVCSNAGIYPGASIGEITAEDWDLVQNINLRGGFFCVKHAIPYMRERGYGRIVITSSVTGAVTGFPGWTHYGASKAGLLGMMRSAALELAKDGVTVNAVMPGNVRTPAWSDLPEDYLRNTEAAIPLGRLAEPSDIANAVSFFADERTAYVTGQTLIIDGGQVLPEIPMN